MTQYRFVVFLVLGSILIGAGGWFYWYMQQTNSNSESSTTVTTVPSEPQLAIERPAPIENDSDRDGIPDTVEAERGTSNKRVDTDGDGLSDYQEINTYETDPTKEDTDGDGFSDLTELANGYDPLVP